MSLIKQAWVLGKNFFFDKEQRKKACLLLSASIILECAMVYGSVLLNKWSNDFYTSLQNLDKESLYGNIKTWCLIVFFLITVFVVKYVCRSLLALNWRKYLTEIYYTRWADKGAYFGSDLLGKAGDNPDQRISADINSFVTLSIDLTLEVLSSIITLVSFCTILWSLSGILKFSLLGYDFAISGYLVWVAIIYSVIGTIVTFKIGKRLASVDYAQEKKEADFRFSMMRFRENGEAIAIYKGEEYEKNVFQSAFTEVVNNFLRIISITKNLALWSNFYNNLSNILPIIIASPRLFAKEIQLGGLMQIASAFARVEGAFAILVNSFTVIASYKAVVSRLTEFNANINAWEQTLETNKITISEAKGELLSIKDLTIKDPSDKTLLDRFSYQFLPGNAYLVTGRNGSGKSTLIKAMNGMWVFGEGEIIFPEGKSKFFIPQKSYMPKGTLLQAITYPDSKGYDLDMIEKLMEKANIGYLVERLHNEENWSIALSGGEQQKISILRAIIHNPDILVMDECSSALTIDDEETMYDLLKSSLFGATIVSVGHRDSLRKFHSHEIAFA
jgi:vitamin B12/bleomycin/antimicrobial peptide transport system ATP-binding/permease protein